MKYPRGPSVLNKRSNGSNKRCNLFGRFGGHVVGMGMVKVIKPSKPD